MPIYEYRCTACQTVTEVLQKMSDPPLATCVSCSGRLEKLLSRTSFHLSGGGWSSSGYTRSAGSNGKGETTGGDAATGPQASTSAPAPAEKGSGGCGAGCGCH